MKTFFLSCFAVISFSSNGLSQNVGIGTSNPTGKLHIDLNGTANTLAVIIDNNDDAAIRFRRLGISNGFLQTFGNDFRLGTYATNNLGNLIFATSSLNRMYITPAGNTGIGIADPLSKLHIGGGNDVSLASHGYLMMGNVDAANLVFDNNEMQARNNGAASTLFLQANGGKTQLGSSIDNNIQTDGVNIQQYYNGAAGELVLQGLSGGKTRFGSGLDFANPKVQISTGIDAGLADNQSGYLMIGQSSNANVVFDNNEIQARSNGSASTLFLNYQGGNVRIGDGAFTASHKLGVAGDAVVTGNLRVGAATLPSGYSFGVDGKMICTEVLVRTVPTWPDYVFKESYHLQSINGLEKFIQTNNRLPNIPSAKEIKKEGLTLGEMQRLQMEKIEELTLYIIQLKKEIDDLKRKTL